MIEKKDYRYSLFGRFIGLTFLIFVSIILSIIWQVKETHQKIINENLADITFSINQSIVSNFKNAEYKLSYYPALSLSYAHNFFS